MNLSKTAKYAIRVVSYMAMNGEGLYSASFLVKELNVSDKYLKRILTTLSNSSIIRSVQGRSGGFKLGKNMEDISLYEIIKSVENIEKYSGCVLGFPQCSDENPCALHSRWIPIQREMMNFFKETTILEVVKNRNIFKF